MTATLSPPFGDDVVKVLAPGETWDHTLVCTGTLIGNGEYPFTNYPFSWGWTSSYSTAQTGHCDFTVEALTTKTDGNNKQLAFSAKGIPQVMFSQRPFSAWNFDCIARTSFTGEYALSGLLGIASDDSNYIVGYIENGKIGIGVVRAGIKTTLVDVVDATIVPDTVYDVRFWHRDGVFGVETKVSTDTEWPTRGSQLTYSWLETDGVMATIDDIFHVGIYGLIDPPKFRTVGFRSSGSIIPILPLDINPDTGVSDAMTLFPWSGKVDIEGTIYTYDGIWPSFTAVSTPYTEPLGPYQLRSVGDVVAPYSKPPPIEGDDNAMTGAGGRCITILQFAWLANTVGNEGLFSGATVGSTAGYSFFENAAQWKVWITTSGKLVWIRERARHYVEDQYAELIGDDFGTLSSKIYITNGMDGVAPVDEIENEFVYEEGTFVFLDSDDKIDIYGFYAVSGDHDQNLKSLLGKFCKIAGTAAIFPGDFTLENAIIVAGEPVNLQSPPDNNNFDTPFLISSFPYTNTQNTTTAIAASDDPTLPCTGTKGSCSVWYSFTPSANGRLNATTVTSNYDTVLALWTGTRGGLVNVACNDDAVIGIQSELIDVVVNSGVPYFIEIAGFSPSSPGGTLNLSVDFAPD